MELLVLLVIVGAVVGGVLYLGSKKRAEAATADVVDPLRKDARGIDPRAIKVGDVIAHEGRDFLVRGTLAFDQDGFRWQEHHLDDASTRRWLSVEDDEELELCLWESVPRGDLEPGPATVTHDGVVYERDEHGRATYAAKGSTGTAPAGTVEFYDYAAGDRRLSFERFGADGDWEMGLGQVVNERTLDIYPSSPTA